MPRCPKPVKRGALSADLRAFWKLTGGRVRGDFPRAGFWPGAPNPAPPAGRVEAWRNQRA